MNIKNIITKIKQSMQKRKILKEYNPYTYNLKDGVYQYYIHMVKDNKKISKDIATKKLNRNIFLAPKIKRKEMHINTYYYGKLRIVVDEYTKEIIFLENSCDKECCQHFHKDRELYHKLNWAYGLKNTNDSTEDINNIKVG